MKVMHLLQSNHFSGAENVVCQIINLFNDEKNVEMFYCSRDGQIKEELLQRNIKFVPIKSLTRKEVKRVIKEQKPDIIHAHDMRASFVASRCCKKTRLISHVHNNNFNSRGLSVKSIAYLIGSRKFDHIFWVSQSSYEGYAFHKFLKKKSEVLYNIIDIDSLKQKMSLDKNEYSYDIVYLGRLTTQKNPIRLMNVFKTIIDLKPNVKIAVIGSGDLEKETVDEATRLGIKEKIDFLGFQSNPYKILKDSKVMLMTSYWEGTPMCILEALSLGVPVVSTPVDGVKNVIKDNYNGYLSEENNELAKKCILLIENIKIHNEMSENCLKTANEMMDIAKYKNAVKKEYLVRKGN
ncbi:MAG: glycosyltransferase [Bacilli bacterium]|nr:glycosyltransferase [Bacilli bacterium]